MGHSDLDRFTRTRKTELNFPFSREKRPEFRRKRDLCEPLLTAMAQVLPFLIVRAPRNKRCKIVSFLFLGALQMAFFDREAVWHRHVVANPKPPPVGGGVKQGRFVILRFPLFCSVCGFQDTQMLGKTARQISL